MLWSGNTVDRHALCMAELWITPDILAARKRRRTPEKQMNHTCLHKQIYTEQLYALNAMKKEAKRKFFTTKLRSSNSSQSELFSILASLLDYRELLSYQLMYQVKHSLMCLLFSSKRI